MKWETVVVNVRNHEETTTWLSIVDISLQDKQLNQSRNVRVFPARQP